MSETRKIDVIIPTYHPDEKLEKCLRMLKRQTVQPQRILLINTEEEFFHSKVFSTLKQGEIIHITKPEFDHGGTRNQAAAMCDGEIMILLTQDAIPADEHLIENLIKPFEDEEVCAAYRKSEYNALGGFPLHTIFNEDMIFASHLIEAGKKIAYAADAKVWHWHNYTAKDQLKRNFDLAVSQVDAGGLFTQVKSESEGIRLVKMTLKHFIKKGQFYYIPKIITQNGAKYIGYRLGKNYKKLPKKWILKISLNPWYWK